MASISSNAGALLDYCLAGERWPRELLHQVIDAARAPEGSRALFSTVIERLGDLFEPRLADTYAELFSEIIARVMPEYRAEELVERYRRIRRPREAPARVQRVFVLSRVTLGADVSVTSVVLAAAKQRFPDAEIYFVGARKGWELFEADAAIRHLPVPYGRAATLEERLAASRSLATLLNEPDSIVIDPDSRLTQLGLVPVCPEERYFFFESRAYGGDGTEPLPVLAARWVEDVFGVRGARPFVAPAAPAEPPAEITVSLGVGENPAKRIADPFEPELLAHLARTGRSVLVDKGAGGEETQRVERSLVPGMGSWQGAFAPFAAQIARSCLYVGYDSAGQHVAAACGVPLVCVFAGFPSERMFARWRPTGAGPITVIRGDADDVPGAVRRAIDTYLSAMPTGSLTQ